MVDKSNIERKDFSIPLYQIIKKVGFVADLLTGYKYGENEFSELVGQHPKGIGIILHDIEDDLCAINKALYPSKLSKNTTWADERLKTAQGGSAVLGNKKPLKGRLLQGQ